MADLLLIQTQAKQAKELLMDGKHQESEALMGQTMKLALEHYKDEQAPEMAEYYYVYGTILVSKITETLDLFGQRVQDAENEALGDESSSEQEEHKIQREDAEGLDDFQLAWENLEVARTILEKQTQNANFEDMNIIRNLAKVLVKLAELDQWRDKFEDARENLEKALLLKQKCEDNQTSRDIAQTYFLLGNVISYNCKEGSEQEVLDMYYKAIQILENNLAYQQQKEFKQIEIADEYDKQHLMQLNTDADDVKYLKETMCLVYEKIEDVQVALKETQTEEYRKLKEQATLQKQQMAAEEHFAQQPQEQKPIVQLGNFGNARKKQEEPKVGEDGEPVKKVKMD